MVEAAQYGVQLLGLPATSEIPANADTAVLRGVADELRAGIVNQFGLE